MDELAGNVSDEDSGSWADEGDYGNPAEKVEACSGDEYDCEDEYGGEAVSHRESAVVIQSKSVSPRSPKVKKNARLVFNLGYTDYDVVGKVANKYLDMRLKYQEEDHEGRVIRGEGGQKLSPAWDICWHDGPITADYLSKMLPY